MDKSLKFSKDDVRGHLAELGYSNIDDEKLDDFCEDLRRLIKYEEKKKTIGRKLEQLETFEQNMSENKENEDTSSSEHVPKRKRRIRKEEKRRLKEEKLRAKESARSTSSIDVEDTTIANDEVDLGAQTESSSLYIDVNLPASTSDTSKTLPLAASLIDQPPPGFIRVRSGPGVGRRPSSSDPVALHQKYQGYWTKFNVPGEKRHDKLRWAVRGWMMGEEPM